MSNVAQSTTRTITTYYEAASDAWTTTGGTLHKDAPLPLPPMFGHGDTPLAAAVDLATKLGLLK